MEGWRSFVYVLGPLGVSTVPGTVSCCTTATTTNSTKNCQECCRLVHGIHVDHHTLSIRKKNGTWWGLDHIDWWYECLLQSTNTIHPSSTSKTFANPTLPNEGDQQSENEALFYARIDQQLQKVTPIPRYKETGSSSSPSHAINCREPHKWDDHEHCLDWLDKLMARLKNKTRDDDDAFATGPRDDETTAMLDGDRFLPRPYVNDASKYCNVSENDSSGMSDSDLLLQLHVLLSGNNAIQYEMIGYKVLILCHLHSVVHIGIEPYIQQLFHAAAAITIGWNRKDSSHAARTSTGSTNDTTKASVPLKGPNHIVHPSNEVGCDHHDDSS
jgi:hypothetical protein